MGKTLDIVIVNWNSGNQLRDCLDSIALSEQKGVQLNCVVVVDNASTDGSADRLGDFRLPLRMVWNESNKGFGPACNQGAVGCQADYILFLNPDTILFDRSLTLPVEAMEDSGYAGVGIVGIQLVDEEGEVMRSCARFPSVGGFAAKTCGLDRVLPNIFWPHFMTEWDHRDTRQVDQVIGAFFLVRRTLFERLQGFDERFFVYFEEVDFALRARQLGWKSVYLATAQAFHKGGGTSEQVKATRLFYSLRSRIQYGYKHFGPVPGTALLIVTLVVEPLSRLALSIARGSVGEARETLAGFARLWTEAPSYLRKPLVK